LTGWIDLPGVHRNVEGAAGQAIKGKFTLVLHSNTDKKYDQGTGRYSSWVSCNGQGF
jgi:hypothetical protein